MLPPNSTTTGISRFIPGLGFFKGLNPEMLRTEFFVAVTVFAVFVPSSMAFGDLAGVTAVAGLYVALGAMVMYALFGTSRRALARRITRALIRAQLQAKLIWFEE
jgi:sulfate permease, SulP family